MQTKNFPVVDESGELMGYRLGYVDHGETEAKQIAAVAAWALENPKPLELQDDASEKDKQAYEQKLVVWTDAAQKVGDAVEPIYGVPAGCMDIAVPKHDDTDVLMLSAGVWTLLPGEKLKRQAAAEKAKAAELAAEKQAELDAQALAANAQAQRYADGLKVGFSAAQVSWQMNGYAPPAK